MYVRVNLKRPGLHFIRGNIALPVRVSVSAIAIRLI